MSKEKILSKLLSLWVAGSLTAAPLFAQEGKMKESGNPSQTQKNKYAYAVHESGDIRFFPVDKARWNGYEVRASEWDQLTDFLKMRFLRDARTEIEVHENAVILVNDMTRLQKAMDESLRELQADPKLKDMPVIKFFYIMLVRNNAIKKAWTLVKVTKRKKK